MVNYNLIDVVEEVTKKYFNTNKISIEFDDINKEKTSTFSISEIATHYKCKFRHKLIYIDGLYTFSQNINSMFGTIIHRCVQDYVTEKNLNPMFEFEIAMKQWIKENTNYGLNWSKENFILPGLKMLKYFLDNKHKFDIFNNVNSIKPEYEVIYEYAKGIKLKGIIDLFIEKDGYYHIVDIKTKKNGFSIYEKRDKMLYYQLTLYKYLIHKKYNIPLNKIKTYFMIMKKERVKKNIVELMEVKVGNVRIKNFITTFNNFLMDLKNKNYQPRPTEFNCTYCNVKQYCQYKLKFS